MTNDPQLKIFGLIDVAERQQTDLSAAIQALQAERLALRAEWTTLAKQDLAHAGQQAGQVMTATATPMLERLERVVQAAGQTERQLQDTAGRTTRRWLGIAAVTAGGLLVAAGIAGAGLFALYHYRLDSLSAEIAEQEAALQQLSQAGGRAKLTHCGKTARLCVQIDKTAGEYQGGYFVIRGY